MAGIRSRYCVAKHFIEIKNFQSSTIRVVLAFSEYSKKWKAFTFLLVEYMQLVHFLPPSFNAFFNSPLHGLAKFINCMFFS